MPVCRRVSSRMQSCVSVSVWIFYLSYETGMAGIGLKFSTYGAPGYPATAQQYIDGGTAGKSGLLSPGDEVMSCLCSPLAILLSLYVCITHTHTVMPPTHNCAAYTLLRRHQLKHTRLITHSHVYLTTLISDGYV